MSHMARLVSVILLAEAVDYNIAHAGAVSMEPLDMALPAILTHRDQCEKPKICLREAKESFGWIWAWLELA